MTKPRYSISWTTYTAVFSIQYWIVVAAAMLLLTPILHIVFKFEKVKLKHLVILFLNASKKNVINNEHFNLSMVAQMAEQAT